VPPAIGAGVLGLAVGKPYQAPVVAPVRRMGITTVPLGELARRRGGQVREQGRRREAHSAVVVAGAQLDDKVPYATPYPTLPPVQGETCPLPRHCAGTGTTSFSVNSGNSGARSRAQVINHSGRGGRALRLRLAGRP